MSDSKKFVQWISDRVQASLTDAKASGDALSAWRDLDEVRSAFENDRMLFGAVISSHLPVLRSELGPWIDTELARLGKELEAGVLKPLGHVVDAAPTKGGPLARLTSVLFGEKKAPSPHAGTRDEAAALEFAKRAGLALVHLLDHDDPAVRLVIARSLSMEAAVPKILVRLRVEREASVAHALLLQLTSAQIPSDVAVSVGTRFPELRPLLLMSRLSHSPQMLHEVATDPQTRLDALLALAEPSARLHAAMRNQVIIEALKDGDGAVQRAALKGVRTWSLTAAGPSVRTLAQSGAADALETLAALSTVDPELGFALIVANARKSPPVLTGLELLAQAKHLSLAQKDELEALLPSLPNGPAADAIRRRVSQTKPSETDDPLAALAAAIDERPDDEKAWLVWSDAAQGLGDPRGELVALAQSGKNVQAALEQNLGSLAPGLVHVIERPATLLKQMTLHMGLPSEVTFGHDEKGTQAELVAAVLSAPLGRFVRSVKLGLTSEVGDDNDWAPSLEALNRYGSHVRSLLLGDFIFPDESEMSWVDWGNIEQAFTLPALERLLLRGGHGQSCLMSSPTLTSLTIETGGLSVEVVNQLISSKVPALTSLTLWTGDSNYGADTSVDDIGGVLSWAPPRLSRLGIENCEYTHELVPLFAKSALTKRLSHLSFANGVLRAEDVSTLLSHAQAFVHLERLDLSANLLGDAESAEIAAVLPNAVLADQREDYGDGETRYVAVGE